MYDELAEWCDDKSKELGFEIKIAHGEVDRRKAESVELTATKEQASGERTQEPQRKVKAQKDEGEDPRTSEKRRFIKK